APSNQRFTRLDAWKRSSLPAFDRIEKDLLLCVLGRDELAVGRQRGPAVDAEPEPFGRERFRSAALEVPEIEAKEMPLLGARDDDPLRVGHPRAPALISDPVLRKRPRLA